MSKEELEKENLQKQLLELKHELHKTKEGSKLKNNSSVAAFSEGKNCTPIYNENRGTRCAAINAANVKESEESKYKREKIQHSGMTATERMLAKEEVSVAPLERYNFKAISLKSKSAVPLLCLLHFFYFLNFLVLTEIRLGTFSLNEQSASTDVFVSIHFQIMYPQKNEKFAQTKI